MGSKSSKQKPNKNSSSNTIEAIPINNIVAVTAQLTQMSPTRIPPEPKNMYLYLMHNNPIANSLINFVIKTFFPVPVWTQRRPFKNYPE